MAKPATLLGTQLFIKIGDGASPETFAHPCLINSTRGLDFTVNGNKIEVPDCTSPDDPAWMEFVKQSLECALNGAGVLDNVAATILAYTEMLSNPLPTNVQIWLGTIGHWAGAFHLTKFSVSGDRGQKITCTVGFDSDGAVVWTSGS